MRNRSVQIHPTAIVHENAQLGEGTEIGPYSIIGGQTITGKNCTIQEHVVLRGITQLGESVAVFPFVTIGADPQHLLYKGEPTRVVIGDRVVLREGVTVHRGTAMGGGVTTVKDDAYLMAYSHVAHDCVVGKNVIITNAVLLAGHVLVDDHAVVGGMSAIAQHCRVGKYCYIGGGSILRKDLAPFLTGKGNDFEIQGVNVVGLNRRGFSSEAIAQIKKLYKIFYLKNLTVTKALAEAEREFDCSDEVKVFLDFIHGSKLGLIR